MGKSRAIQELGIGVKILLFRVWGGPYTQDCAKCLGYTRERERALRAKGAQVGEIAGLVV